MTKTPVRFVVGASGEWRRWVQFHLENVGAEVVADLPAGAHIGVEYRRELDRADAVLFLSDGSDAPLGRERCGTRHVVGAGRDDRPWPADHPRPQAGPLPSLLPSRAPLDLSTMAETTIAAGLLSGLGLAGDASTGPPRYPRDGADDAPELVLPHEKQRERLGRRSPQLKPEKLPFLRLGADHPADPEALLRRLGRGEFLLLTGGAG